MSDIVKQIGKFRYIEPNDILEHEMYPKRAEGARSYNITHPYEDYSIDVELEVAIPRRGIWNNKFHDTQSSISTATVDTETFFGGTDGYLTSTPGSMIYKDILNNEADRESLGITNIHITYNSYFVPEVTINFTDIRGMGLFMPHEEAYRNFRQQNNGGSVEKFFAALFTFPYPEFTLKVKGFYGKRVSYSLVVSDFKSSFNNQTGNFDATVKFIGKMYGVYTDIPMSYLLIAPYCKYGTGEETVWESCAFTFENGSPIPTLLELKKDILEANTNLNEILGNSLDGSQSLFSTRQLLSNMKTAYDNMVLHITTSITGVLSDNTTGIFLFPESTISALYPTSGNNSSQMLVLTQTLYDEIEAYETAGNTGISQLKGLSQRTSRVGDAGYCINITKTGNNITVDSIDNAITFDLDNNTTLKQQIYGLPDGEIKFFVVNASDFVTSLQSKQETNTSDINAIIGTIRNNIDTSYSDILGFTPTIKNIFTIVLAHLQAFLTVFNKCITNINSNTNRTIKNKRIDSTMLPDIPTWVTNDSHLPPFPAIKSTLQNTFVYPTEVVSNMEEDDFINYMFSGCSKVISDNTAITTHAEAVNNTKKYFIPTCITDFNCYDYSQPNPYTYVFKDNDNIQSVDWLLTFFGHRCVQKFLLEKSHSDVLAKDHDESVVLSPEQFGVFEAYNFWLAHPTLTDVVYNKIFNTSDINGDNFISFLKGSHSFDGTTVPSLWTTGALFVNTDTENSSNVKALGLSQGLSYPARIGHNSNYKTQYILDGKDDNNTKGKYGFLRGANTIPGGNVKIPITEYGEYSSEDSPTWNTYDKDIEGSLTYEVKPYGLMREIPLLELNKWQQALLDVNINNYDCSPLSKLIDQYKNIGAYKLFYYHNTELYTVRSRYEEYPENPTHNVTFQTGPVSNFYQKFSNDNWPFLQYDINAETSNLKTYSYLKTNNGSNVFVHSMKGLQRWKEDGKWKTIVDVPMFFRGNLDAGIFLSEIPHNLEGLVHRFRDGKKIMQIPYVTKLFIGFLISEVQASKGLPYRHLSTKLNNIRRAAMAMNDYSSHFEFNAREGTPWPYNYFINGKTQCPETIDSYGAFLYILLCYTTCNAYSVFKGVHQWGTTFIDALESHYEETMTGNMYYQRPFLNIYVANEYGLFDRDIFGFAKEYKEWADSNSSTFKTVQIGDGNIVNIPGFKWLYNNMGLSENKVNNKYVYNNDNLYKQLTATSPIGRLMELLTTKAITDKLSNLNSSETQVNTTGLSAIAKSLDNPLNHYYKSREGCETPNNTTAFGERYCSIMFWACDDEVDADELDEKNCVYLQFNPEWKGTQLLNNLLKHNEYLILPYNRIGYTSDYLTSSEHPFKRALESFISMIKQLHTRVNDEETTEVVTPSNAGNVISKEQKLSMYRTLKNLYDKHFTNLASEIDKYDITGTGGDCEIDRFHFIDTYYNDLSDNLLINTDTIVSLIDTVMDTYGNGGKNISTDMSLYSFLSLICQRHNMLFISMPIFNGSIKGDEGNDNFKNMFKPLSKSSAGTIYGPSYICFYPHQASQHLDIPISQYRNDSFLITDINETDTFEGPTTITGLSESSDGGYTIPAFSVEYGTQKQSIFTNINVNMDNPQITEAAVAIQFGLANQNNTDVGRLTMDGQDLFKIYSNYSYTCQVEMMGCAQVQPLMYFQLNNIPMFRGAYQIINVEHDITPGNMITVFKGVRINKTNIPMTRPLIDVNVDTLSEFYAMGNVTTNTQIFTLKNFTNSSINLMNNHTNSTISYQFLTSDNSTKNLIVFESETAKINFNLLNPSLRQLIYCILQDLPTMEATLGYRLGICVTSTIDNNNTQRSNTSDHKCLLKHADCSPKAARYNITGLKLNEDGSQDTSATYNYAQMGCAIDFCATKDGTKDKGEPSIQLFNHIIRHYYQYITQFAWEVESGQALQDAISHIIHLASFGLNPENTKTDVFMAADSGRDTIRNGRQNASAAYKAVSSGIANNDKINNITMTT